jgi:hypothetical protein
MLNFLPLLKKKKKKYTLTTWSLAEIFFYLHSGGGE